MFARLLYQSFLRQRRRKALAGLAIMLGVGVATAMIAVATDIGDKMNAELRTYGANILVYPQDDSLDVNIGGIDLKPAGNGAFLREADLPTLKTIFWGHNILAFAPMLPVRADVTHGTTRIASAQIVGTYFAKPISLPREQWTTGVRKTHPWWNVNGAWPEDDSDDVLIGEALAQTSGLKAGDAISIGSHASRISGVLTADAAANNEIIAPLHLAQAILGRAGAVKQIYVSALTKPEDELARRDPSSMSPEMHDRWYCSPYANSIAFQIAEAIPGAHAEQIRQVAQNEGKVLNKISGLMLLLALAALVASALAVSAAMATSVFERRTEIGLMKAIGAGKAAIAALFVSEATLLALLAGVAGFVVGALLAQQIGRAIFSTRIGVQPVVLPVVIAIALAMTLAGSAASIRRAIELDPAIVLRGDA
jgi:putative ABC transport system permease protein